MSESMAKDPDPSGAGYFPQLDGLRAVAVAAVFIGHLIPLRWLQKVVSWGDMGVVLFFCLSGFLITGILLRIQGSGAGEKARGLGSFYVRRALRIFPIYYLALGVAVAVGYAPARQHLFRLATYTLHVPGLPPTDNLGAVSHFWSLSVEEQFYIFWPMLVLFFPRRHLRRFVVALVVLSWGYKLSLALAGVPYKPVFWSLWGCLDSLGLGALLATEWHEPARRAASVRRWIRVGKVAGALWAGLTAVRIAAEIDPYYEGYRWFGVVYFAVAAIAFTGLIGFAASGTRGWLGRLLGGKAMVQTGRISYGLYVYHFFFPFLLPWMVGRQYIRLVSPWEYSAASVACSIVVAVLSWRLVEKPLLRLKELFPYAKPASGRIWPGR